MVFMPDLSLSVSFSTYIIVTSALLAAVLSVFVYRVTIPPIPTGIRFFLAVLRTLGLFFLFLLIAEPLVSLLRHTVEPPQTLVLVDNSRSMTITDQSGIRSEELRSVLASGAIRQLSDIGEVRFALFDSRVQFLSSFSYDSLSLTGDGTNLSAALRQVKEEARKTNIRAVVILSDGNSTSGSSPVFDAEDLQIPLFTIGIGDTTERRDVVLRSVQTNALTYAGTRVPVNATVRSAGYDGRRVEITLRDSTTVLDRQFLTLQGGEREYTVRLNFVPEKPGIQKYIVSVSDLPGELTDQNNRATFFTKVMKSKMRVFILGGSPSADLAFIRRALEQDPNLEVTTVTEQPKGDISPGTFNAQILKVQDCLLLVGIPRAETSPTTLNIIANAINAGLPLFFLASRQLDLSRIAPLEPVLPVILRRNLTNEVQSFLQVPEIQKGHVILRRKVTTDDPWHSLPPLFQLQHDIRVKPEAQVLAFSRINTVITTTPSIALRSVAGQKSLAVMAYGLWRWKMLGDKQQEDVLNEFLSNAIRWLTSRDDNKKIRVRPTLEFFSSRDPVEFVGQVYNDAFQPLDDAHITVSIGNKDRKSDLALSSLGNGQYAGELGSLPEGDYSFAAQIQRDGVTLGRETGSFSVGDLAVEFLETQAHPLLLRQLAARTGGAYFGPDQRDRLPEAIRSIHGFRGRDIVRSAEIEVWNAQWSMAFLLALFATEWFVRKRYAMI